MLEDLKSVMEENKNLLPLISMYWKYTIVDNNKTNENSNDVVSIIHNTTHYVPRTFYKPISTTIDMSYYYE